MSIGRVAAVLLLATSVACGSNAANANEDAAERRTERGPVTATVRLEPIAVPFGDAVSLTLEVTALAGVELLMPAFGTSLERFTIREFVPRERIDDQGRSVASQRYLLDAPASGEQAIPPITIEFVDRRPGQRAAPEDEDAFELLTERIPFRVDSVVPAGASDDLKPALGPLDALESDTARTWPWVAAGTGVLLLALVFLFKQLAAGIRTRRRSAFQVALERLDALEARPRPQAAAMDGFFVELTDLVRHYLEDRFALHAPELTTEEFLDVAARSPDLTRDHRGFLQDFLRSADRVKFARHVPEASDVEQVLSAVRDFLQQTAADESHAGRPRAASAAEAAHA